MKKGSILVYALVVMTIMLAIAIGMSAVSLNQQKSAGSTEKSVQALQTADDGAQLATKKINEQIKLGNGGNTINTIFNCGSLSDGTTVANSNYKLSFFSDEKGTTSLDCTTGLISQIRSIKSVGSYGDTVRAVNVAMAASDINWSSPVSFTASASGAGASQATTTPATYKLCVPTNFNYDCGRCTITQTAGIFKLEAGVCAGNSGSASCTMWCYN